MRHMPIQGCSNGGIGRHEGLKILWPVMAVRVQVPLAVLKGKTQKHTSLLECVFGFLLLQVAHRDLRRKSRSRYWKTTGSTYVYLIVLTSWLLQVVRRDLHRKSRSRYWKENSKAHMNVFLGFSFTSDARDLRRKSRSRYWKKILHTRLRMCNIFCTFAPKLTKTNFMYYTYSVP